MTFNLTLISSLPPTRFYILIIPFSNAIKMFKSFAFFPPLVASDFRKIPKLNSYLGHNSKYWWKISDTEEGRGGGRVRRKFLLNSAKVFFPLFWAAEEKLSSSILSRNFSCFLQSWNCFSVSILKTSTPIDIDLFPARLLHQRIRQAFLKGEIISIPPTQQANNKKILDFSLFSRIRVDLLRVLLCGGRKRVTVKK